jgi:hypothetical protein
MIRGVASLEKNNLLVSKDMDINEHERLNIPLKIQIQVKEQCFYCCSAT